MSDGQSSDIDSVYVLQAHEEERYRLAREIHDGPAQVITNAVFALEFCERLIDRDTEALRRELVLIKEDLRASLEEIRRFIYDLRPPTLLELGLAVTIERYLQDFKARFGIQVELRNSTEFERRLPGIVEVAIFRVVQEALQNVRRHASPSQVVVSIDRVDDFLVIRIDDDGEGFDLQQLQDRLSRSWGIVGMRERAELINGELVLHSEPGRGTTVELKVPIGEEKPDGED